MNGEEWFLHADTTIQKALGEAFTKYWKQHPEQTQWVGNEPPNMPGYSGNGEIEFNKANAIALTEMFIDAVENGKTITNDDVSRRFGMSPGVRFSPPR